jgi:hypothetical protein
LITNNQQDITTTSSESSPPTISTVYIPTTRPLITDSQQGMFSMSNNINHIHDNDGTTDN